MASKIPPKIVIQGARTNNLKNISLSIPHNKFIVVTGISGSGKSSLVFEIIAKACENYQNDLLDGVSSKYLLGDFPKRCLNTLEADQRVVVIAKLRLCFCSECSQISYGTRREE